MVRPCWGIYWVIRRILWDRFLHGRATTTEAVRRAIHAVFRVAIDQTSKFAFVETHEKVAPRTAGNFLRRLVAAATYRGPHVLTATGIHFTIPCNTSSVAPDIEAALEAGEIDWAHAFEYARAQNDVDQRLTKPEHPWTNGQLER